MPFSRSRSVESMTRSTTSSRARKAPVWRSMASTSVVLPWSTWATMATLRSASRRGSRARTWRPFGAGGRGGGTPGPGNRPVYLLVGSIPLRRPALRARLRCISCWSGRFRSAVPPSGHGAAASPAGRVDSLRRPPPGTAPLHLLLVGSIPLRRPALRARLRCISCWSGRSRSAGGRTGLAESIHEAGDHRGEPREHERHEEPGEHHDQQGAHHLVLVIVGYNSSDLRAEDQVVGSLLMVVLPGLLLAFVFAWLTAVIARFVGGYRQAGPAAGGAESTPTRPEMERSRAGGRDGGAESTRPGGDGAEPCRRAGRRSGIDPTRRRWSGAVPEGGTAERNRPDQAEMERSRAGGRDGGAESTRPGGDGAEPCRRAGRRSGIDPTSR